MYPTSGAFLWQNLDRGKCNMAIELYNELNGLQVEFTAKPDTSDHFDFSTLYPNDKEELGVPIVVQKGKNNERNKK